MNNNDSEFIDVEWFDKGATGIGSQNIGVVLIYNKYVGFKCYIGIGNGVSIEDDMEHIYKHGTKLSYGVAKGIWGPRMRAEWITRNLAEPDLSFYKYDGHKYLAKQPDALAVLSKMTQGEIKRMVETSKLANELEPLFHALKQIKKAKS